MDTEMTTQFPGAIDGYTDPVATQTLATNQHRQRHKDLQDAIVAVQTTVGVSGSDDPNSIEYRVTQASAAAGGAASALAAHEEAEDPHPVYTTQGEVDVRVATLAPAETAATLGAVIAAATPKTVPVDADSIPISDSAAAGVAKKLTWGNLKAALDVLYARLAGVLGGQTINGGTGAGDSLTLNSTTHATKGLITIGGFAYFSQLLSRLGIGVSSPTARMHIQGGSASAGTSPLKISAGSLLTSLEDGAFERTTDGMLFFTPSVPVGRRRVATDYDAVGSAAGFPNGCCEQRSNAGFAALTYDQVMTRDVSGAWIAPLTASTTYLGDQFPLNSRLAYRVACSIGAGETDASSWSAANRQYIGVQYLDRRGLAIGRSMAQTMPGTITTLAGALSPGDTSMVLTSAANWSVATGCRNFAWGPYSDGEATYPAGEYSRNVSTGASGFSNEAYGVGGISGNTVTLIAPWTGATLPAGTQIWNTSTIGGSYWYPLMGNQPAPLGWTDLEATISRGAPWLTLSDNNIPAGSAFARFVLRCNYHGSADTRIRLAGLSITPVAPGNFPSAIGVGSSFRHKMISELPADGLAVQGRIGAGTSSPAAQIHAIATSALCRIGYDTSNYCTLDVSSTGVTTLATVGTAPALAIAGDVRLDKTITPAGTTGAQTINKQMGSVNIAAGQSSVVVTNNRVTTSSVIVATVATADATLKSVVAVAANGSFTLTGNAAATAETRINFLVLN